MDVFDQHVLLYRRQVTRFVTMTSELLVLSSSHVLFPQLCREHPSGENSPKSTEADWTSADSMR